MDIVVILAIILLLGVMFLLVQKNATPTTKNKALKKEEIIANYEKELKNILLKYQHDKNKQIEQKKLFLQKCSSEFSRNIFFTTEESKQIIQKLAQL